MNAIISTVLLLAVAVGPSLSSAEEPQQLVKPMLSISIQSAQSSYSMKESVRLAIQLENIGREPLVLCRFWGWGVGRTNVRVFDSNGKEVFTNFLADQVPPPPRDTDFVQLGYGEFFGKRLSEHATDLVNTPGTYDILVEYTSAVSEDWARKYVQLPKLPLWSREKGTIVSNRVRIEITK